MSRLSELGMWESWQETAKAALPNFAQCPIFVEQRSVPEEKYRELAEKVKGFPGSDDEGKMRDAEFGARVVDTCLGPVNRMWLEAQTEIDFLFRNLRGFEGASVLDIGAGYGRLAVPLSEVVCDVTCVDAVPISTQICRGYCARFAPSVKVLSLDEFEATYQNLKFDLVCNVHSWNECKLSQIKEWLAVLAEMKVPYLFTVSHGQMNHVPEPSYRAWSDDHPSYRYLLEERYDLIAEESLGLSPNPHALWSAKKR